MKWTVLSDNRSCDSQLQTEHGLSILLETDRHRILLDTGASDVFIRNAEKLGINLRSVDYVFISHGHSDHAGGLQYFLGHNRQAKVIVSPDAMSGKYFFDGSLRMEPDEWLCITQLVTQMRQELQTHEDSPSLRSVLLAYLRLILEYCNRIYQRQLFEEDRGEADLLKRFHNLLQTYFRENRQLMQGLPTVTWCASELAYSPRYFGDIVHKATGGTAIGYIHNYVINQAKILLMQGHNISETSCLLGFDFPHHFTRLFKRITGLTPSEFIGK